MNPGLFKLPACFMLLLAARASAQSYVSLAPSTSTLGRAEAVTSTASGADAIFYNPALLARGRISLRLAGIETTTGADANKVEERNSNRPLSFEEQIAHLEDQGRIHESVTVRALDLYVPYVGITTFGRSQAVAEVADDGLTHHYNARVDAGAAAGFAISWHKLSFGYSQIGLVRAVIDTKPNLDHLHAINEAVKNDTLSTDTAAFREFTDIYYGGTKLHNFGLLYQWWENNPSGIAVSVLNAGGGEFAAEAPYNIPEAKEAEKTLREKSNQYQIELLQPDPVPEMVNIGVNFGMGGDSDSWFDARVAVDCHDCAGQTLAHKFAASYEFGLYLPDPVAMATAVPFYDSRWFNRDNNGVLYHIGLLHLKAFGGWREKEYTVNGAGIGLHLGAERRVSVIKIEIEGFQTKPFHESNIVPEKGLRATLGLTLVY